MKIKLLFSFLVIGAFIFSSCGKDAKCQDCDLSGTNVEVCELDNGNAEVAGIDLNIDYDTYITSLEITGYDCK